LNFGRKRGSSAKVGD